MRHLCLRTDNQREYWRTGTINEAVADGTDAASVTTDNGSETFTWNDDISADIIKRAAAIRRLVIREGVLTGGPGHVGIRAKRTF
jgi:hypothetical protein